MRMRKGGGVLKKMAGGSLEVERVPFTLTYVQYEKGDLLGMFLALCSLGPVFLMVSFATLILFRRDLQTVTFWFGLVLNELLNFVLKHLINAPRPTEGIDRNSLLVEYGMPSGHAQFMGFFATYFTLLVFFRVLLSTDVMDLVWKSLLTAAVISASAVVCISRYYLGYHSNYQILCGVAVGSLVGGVWFAVMQFVLSPLFPYIFYWKISEIMLLKDMSLIPNVLWFEFTSLRMETRKRMRKSQ